MANIHDIAHYFLLIDDQHDGGGISNLKLQKLVYYAQGFHLALFARPLFQNDIEAWTHGPVTPDLYHQHKAHKKQAIPLDRTFDTNSLTTDEKELMDEIYEVFGQFTAWKLRDMTHEEAPWLDNMNNVIPHDDLEKYFKTRLN